QEVFFGVLRWQLRLDWIISQFYDGDYTKAPANIRHILQLSFYQLLYLDKIPDYAVIHEAVKLAKKIRGDYWGKKINAILRAFQRNRDQIRWPDRSVAPIDSIAIEYSHPHWLVQRWMEQWGLEETIALCQADNQTPQISLRVNRLKNSRHELQKMLASLQIEALPSPYLDDFLIAERLPELSNFSPFQQGLFTVQDVSAGLACRLLAPEAGERILDLCAAPGGKTTYLAELMGDRGIIVAVDRYFNRLQLVSNSVQRLRLKSVQLVQADGTQFACQPVDRILLDAPCSGLGVLAKRVDLRWKRTAAAIDELADLQLRLLENAGQLLKTGGVLVYCTCTIEPAENEQVISRFLTRHKEFEIERATEPIAPELITKEGFISTRPQRDGMDGSFAARLKKVVRE
ncbi:MAG: 16S rRNA (cytosine(967)-C(5))-methyltransferase RsmB, partial [candidate division KSB1 bacterium]|nr:16S rRNA (cytosine(967)-C(5))-methyltransferase RsmB [candidate division KSB1 bacterium]